MSAPTTDAPSTDVSAGSPPGRGRILIAVAASVALLLAAGAYIVLARRGDPAPVATAPVTLEPGPRLLFVSARHLAVSDRADPDGARSLAGLECVRTYAAAGTGVCIHPVNAWTYQLMVLDAKLGTTKEFTVPGLPNRARVSASGRMVAWTTFVGGDSYNSGGFSTRTGIYDTRSGTLVGSLEEFAVTLEGRPHRAQDVNFWGVTFAADDNRFYATMSSGGHRYLIQGDFAARTVRTLASNVECPSLSPDGTRIAFKQAIDDQPTNGWRLSRLDLDTMRVTNLAETRSVDDQAAWLDDRTVAYTLRAADGTPSIWTVAADGTGEPSLLVADAESPAAL
ncbi:TolB-like translocation protein; signal peptide [Catellatospora sp. TT07R-123]|uniref:TolB family protein n=1 Tax=Catellatospora sp. TT07R-123 TaxID=2733863 RepID=UPI001B239B4B|nr:PD40 domain-containing protein [Catellatospora sp. TT07R-123]GHJ47861.1 TolB-like translocation protein; signal peptide [Catellatospora sp. TT07R-123]